MRVYTLYPAWPGYSNKTVDYHCVAVYIWAANNKQAHLCARRNVWHKGDPKGAGILCTYSRDAGHRYWNTTRPAHSGPGSPEDGKGVTYIRRWLEDTRRHAEEGR